MTGRLTNAGWRRRAALLLLALLAPLAALGACSVTPDHESVEIIDRFKVGPAALPACVAAAKRASYWCGRRIPSGDQFYAAKCLEAEWEYARACN